VSQEDVDNEQLNTVFNTPVFAKVFGQIFDSSIAEDYNCRRMFMDLLVLADSDGAVDMTPEAISRRTNVPMSEVVKYIKELSQPDPLSRSKEHEGKRLVPLEPGREWGWLIVNYQHYREIRDEEARRTYFRDYQRDRRGKLKKLNTVQDTVLTGLDENGQKFSPASASASKKKERSGEKTDEEWLKELCDDPTYNGIDVRREFGKMSNWCRINKQMPTRRRFINWLNRADRSMSSKNNSTEQPTRAHRLKQAQRAADEFFNKIRRKGRELTEEENIEYKRLLKIVNELT